MKDNILLKFRTVQYNFKTAVVMVKNVLHDNIPECPYGAFYMKHSVAGCRFGKFTSKCNILSVNCQAFDCNFCNMNNVYVLKLLLFCCVSGLLIKTNSLSYIEEE